MKTELIHAYEKITNKYTPAWAEFEETSYMGFDVEAVYGEPVMDDEAITSTVYLTASKAVNSELMNKMLHHFDMGCRCEHDCCGHLFGGAHSIKRVGRNNRKWVATLRYRPNI